MITSGIMKILHESIQIYDKLCGKNYLIVFGLKNKYKFINKILSVVEGRNPLPLGGGRSLVNL